MTVEVFWASGSPFSWRVLLALELKQVPYVGHVLEFSKGETRTPQYLKLNPRGRVPTLKNGDFVLSESPAIFAYLEEKFPDPPLLGRTAEEKGRIWQHISECSDYLVRSGLEEMAVPIFFGRVAGKADEIRAATAKVRGEFDRVEETLRTTPWLVGQAISAADIALYPFIEVVLRAAAHPSAQELSLDLLPLAQRYPAIGRWVERIKALPRYERTYPPHWRVRPDSNSR